VQCEIVRSAAATAAKRSGARGRDSASDRAGGHHHYREQQRNTSESVCDEPAHEVGLDQSDRGPGDIDQDVRRRELHQRSGDGRLEQDQSPRIVPRSLN
jgi:hypothetical protein